MTRLINKVRKIRNLSDDLRNDLFFQALPNENKNDFYRMYQELKIFLENIPEKSAKNN